MSRRGGFLHVDPTSTVSDNTPWTHPKITPFRLAFFLTTGGLGTAKAVLVSNGETTSSTTVEWITGVVVALIFQLLGSYDSEYDSARCPQYLERLFNYDCLERLRTSATEPHADSRHLDSPRRLSPDRSELPNIVTGYRLLVSTVFAAFGLAKMLCGYLGFSSAMYTLDWIIAVPLTLGLYYIGLYEERRTRLLRNFFEADYSSQTVLALKIAFSLSLYLGIIALYTYWFKFWLGALRTALAYPYPAPFNDSIRGSPIWNALFEYMLQWIPAVFCIVMLEGGLVCVLWPVVKTWGGRYQRPIRYAGLAVAFVTLYAFFSLMCIYLVVFFLFFAAQIFASAFHPPADYTVSLLERILLTFNMIMMAMLGIPPGIVWFKLPKMLMTMGRSLFSLD